MDEGRLQEILHGVQQGTISPAEALRSLRQLPIESLGHTQIDTHRTIRCGAEEVVFAAGKSLPQLIDIVRAHLELSGRVLLTRVAPSHREVLLDSFPDLVFSEGGQTAWQGSVLAASDPTLGRVAIVTAGTSDAPVAEEAECTARYFGCEVQRVNDVGVAGLHRLLGALPRLLTADALVVVAGMDGALASVVSGLVSIPVIAVPTSVGYGAAFDGLAPLLGMLVSCAPGVSVVNIDNGFGASMVVLRMLGGSGGRRTK